jgi:hypothetical protein
MHTLASARPLSHHSTQTEEHKLTLTNIIFYALCATIDPLSTATKITSKVAKH